MEIILTLRGLNSGFLPLLWIKNEIKAVLSSVLVHSSTGTAGQVGTAVSLKPGNQGLSQETPELNNPLISFPAKPEYIQCTFDIAWAVLDL